MQQVGAKSFVGARPVDPSQLPVPLQFNALRRTTAISLGHAWVLHRRLILRAAGAVLALLLIVGLYEARPLIGAGAEAVVRLVKGEFVAAGFGINRITISGQALTDDRHIAELLALSAGSSTLDFDAEKARTRLSWLRGVESATVRKIYPNQIVVEIVEKEPVARWRNGNTTWLVDSRGSVIGEDPAGAFAELPTVVGEGAADDAMVMVRALEQHAPITKDLAVLSRIGDRRWDLIYHTGLRVQLPELGVAQALNQLEAYQERYALLDRDVTLIDLRVPGLVAVKQTVRDEEAGEKQTR